MPGEVSQRRRRRDSGAMLLAVLFMVAMMVIMALAMAPSLVMQVKRDREEEMIHRGTEYARAVKKFYKKFGRYPGKLEELDNTNQIRFLRRRFKDPLTKDGQWKLLHYGDVQSIVATGGMGMPSAALGAQGGVQGLGSLAAQAGGAGGNNLAGNTFPQGAQASPQQTGLALGNQPQTGLQSGLNLGNQSQTALQSGGATSAVGGGGDPAAGQTGFGFGTGGGQTLSWNGAPTAAAGQGGAVSGNSGSSGAGGQTVIGGAIFGVASTSTDPTIRIFNQKKKYNEWVFIYSPMLDRNPNILLRGPFNGGTTIGSQQIGTPAGQLNQANQGAFGQQPGGLGQQPGGLGQQNQQPNPQQNQQLTPGNQFPPDQPQP